jgi:hypothetical protein
VDLVVVVVRLELGDLVLPVRVEDVSVVVCESLRHLDTGVLVAWPETKQAVCDSRLTTVR